MKKNTTDKVFQTMRDTIINATHEEIRDLEEHAVLLDCPFCGGDPCFSETSDGGHVIECNGCHASSKLVYPNKVDPKEVLIEAWNSRDPKLRISTTRAQALLLKLARTQKELNDLQFDSVDLRRRAAELISRWDKVREYVHAPTDATVSEVFDRIVVLYATASREVMKDFGIK